MNELSLLTPFVDMSKKDISTYSNFILNDAIENGNDALNVIAIGSKMELLGKELKEKGCKLDTLVNELSMNDNKKRVTSNVELSIREVGTKYDYSSTPKILEIDSEIEKLKEEQKIIQDIAKRITTRVEFTTTQGEQIEIYPAGKSSTTSIVTKVL
jgi:hypothetical protein